MVEWGVGVLESNVNLNSSTNGNFNIYGQKIEIRIDNYLKKTSKTDGQTNRQTGKQTKVLYC